MSINNDFMYSCKKNQKANDLQFFLTVTMMNRVSKKVKIIKIFFLFFLKKKNFSIDHYSTITIWCYGRLFDC